ncbi:hypothetical protein BBO_01611 [Beauveria brongniartii RCEF 3172]|uniref:Uncharacterized protein n=1 Tax=Beauveria brongniartii RCEF 3172 TaxID=1081107 RepID=A0A167J9W0_9HYPO|nr:hypothetical protein BBO_01611 [Beauveria brongniartii RCEF 3172]
MTLAVKRKGAASEVERDQPAPTVKRQCTSKTCNSNDDAPKLSSSTSIPNSFVGCNVAESIEEEEGEPHTSAIISTVKLEDGTVIHQEESSRSRITNTKVEESTSQQYVKRESFDTQDLIDFPVEPPAEQHWRCSAAPSPFASWHGAAQHTFIGPEELPSVVHCVLVHGPGNPGYCHCGWYNFYAVCWHQFKNQPYKCGVRQGQSGAAVFCGSPVPQHLVRDYIVNEPCVDCLYSRSGVLRGL